MPPGTLGPVYAHPKNQYTPFDSVFGNRQVGEPIRQAESKGEILRVEQLEVTRDVRVAGAAKTYDVSPVDEKRQITTDPKIHTATHSQ